MIQNYGTLSNLQVVDVKRQIKSPVLKSNFYIIKSEDTNFREILINHNML